MFDMNKRAAGKRPDHEDELEAAATKPVEVGQPRTRVREAAVIGPSIFIQGELRGQEDLIIQGTVKGTIQLKDHIVTIGNEGKVQADIKARSIVVDGQVEGDLHGSDKIAVRRTGKVLGNITAPRVSLDEGAQFKGRIDMDPERASAPKAPEAARPAPTAPKPAPEQPGPGGGKPEMKAKTIA